MKKLRLLTKSLLVAAGLLAWANVAWATVTPVNQNYSGGVADWASDNTGRYTVDMNAGGYLTVNAVGTGDNGTTINGTTVNGKAAAGSDFEASDDFTMIFDLQLTGGSNQLSWFHINDAANGGNNESADGHILSLSLKEANGTVWKINGSETQTVTLAKSTWYTFKLSKSGSLLYLTITPTAGGDAVFSQDMITVKSAKGGLGKMIFQTKRYYSYMAIDNVVVRELTSGDVPAATPTTYTINYLDGDDNPIKSATVIATVAGTDVNAAVQAVDFTEGEQRWIYVSGNETIKTVADAASNVINLKYREAVKYTYTINTNLGGTLVPATSEWEGITVDYHYPRFQLVGDILYEKTAAWDSNSEYMVRFTMPSEPHTETLTYTATSNNGVVFYKEGEELTGDGWSSSSGNSNRASAGKGGYGNVTVPVTTLPAGRYKIYAAVNGGSGATFTFNVAEYSISTTGSFTSNSSNEFSLAESTNITVTGSGTASNKTLDYIYIVDLTKVAIADVKSNESSAAFATYIDGETFTNPEQVYAAHTAWQINNSAVTDGSRDITKAIRNAAIASTTDWTGSRVIELGTEKSNVAPDNFLIDANNQVLDTYQIIYGLPAGKYTVKAATRATATCESGKIYVYAEGQVDKNAAGNHVGNTGGDLDHGWSWTSIDFELTATSDVKFGYYVDATSSKWASCDDWHLTLAGEDVTISALDYSTLASDYDLDFTTLSSSLKAYKATVSGSTITFTAVTTVPAGEGVLLKTVDDLDAPQTFNIPVTTGVAAWGADENAFVRGTGVAVATGSGPYNYVLSTKSGVVGFYQANDNVVPANKAYLQSATDHARIAIGFEDETTGINSVQGSGLKVNGSEAVYNLQGQRVAQPGKGLYIMNGKKVIMK